MPMPDAATPEKPRTNVKETLTSIVIAFVMAFVFRGFVIEGFVIPTGSMAPTLLGQHELLRSDYSGYEWTVGPYSTRNYIPLSVQQVTTEDPMTGIQVTDTQKIRAGDRLFVLKYVEGLFDPKRWDVPVFKYPVNPAENYIKRLVGVPNEQLIFIDGDVFSRPVETEARRGSIEEAVAAGWSERDAARGFRVTSGEAESGTEAWLAPGWRIRRKPERVQRAVWQPVFSSAYTPPPRDGLPVSGFRTPWRPEGGGWEGLRTDPAYTYTGTAPTVLAWDPDRAISDFYPYNVSDGVTAAGQNRTPGRNPILAVFPVSDVRASLGIRPEGEGATASAAVTARGVTWEATVGNGSVVIRRRDAAAAEAWGTGEIVAEGEAAAADLDPSVVTNLEVWHVDQSVSVWIDGKKVAEHLYDWTPGERILASTGASLEELMAEEAANPTAGNPLGDPTLFEQARVAWRFTGGPLVLHRVALDRDLHYQVRADANVSTAVRAERVYGGHPEHFPTLGPDDFFMCGDNSPNSLDSRMWDAVDPWVAASLYGTPRPEADLGVFGKVHRDLLVGRAFIVYFPAPLRDGPILWPDFGRMRWIW